jgi:membrane-bound lytic murein transglycosylase D
MTTILRRLPLLLPILLSACTVPTRPAPAPPVVTLPKPQVEDVSTLPSTAHIAPTADFWATMRASFAMDDCDADPSIAQWAHTYTRIPNRFEQQINEVLPLVSYAHAAAMKEGVAGEFALLPWVESQYRHVPGGRNQPAGMWQIMPQTAHTLGLKVTKSYDERLDIALSTKAVMGMLRKYHDDLNDWRLVDIAYNAGEFGLRKTLDTKGMPPADPAIPRIPMKAVTREHLTKLLAIACVIRDPARFNVDLPGEAPAKTLQVVAVDHPQTMNQAAQQSGLSVDTLRNLNPAYRTQQATVSDSLMLPSSAATTYSLASFTGNEPTSTATPTKLATDDPPEKAAAQGERYKVRNGDTLSSIASSHSVSVKQLMQWNDLRSAKLKLGQVLVLQGR